MKNRSVLILGVITVLSSCAIIRPGEVGVKQKLGRLSEKVHFAGPVFYNPFVGKLSGYPFKPTI